MLPIECESTENQQIYLQNDVDNDKIAIFVVVFTANNNRFMEEKTIWVHIIHYYWQNENGEIKDRIWTIKDYSRAKQFFEIRKDMLEHKVRNATVKVRFEKRNYIHITTEEMGFFTLTLFKQKFQ